MPEFLFNFCGVREIPPSNMQTTEDDATQCHDHNTETKFVIGLRSVECRDAWCIVVDGVTKDRVEEEDIDQAKQRTQNGEDQIRDEAR